MHGMSLKRVLIRLTIVCLLLGGCAFTPKIDREKTVFAYASDRQGPETANRSAPVFLIYHAGDKHNRIGSPVARYDANGFEEIDTDPESPAIFFGLRPFATEKGAYRNLVYRVHFPGIPSIHLSAGKNVGLLVIITLDRDQQPVLVTTVNTCGCYVSVTPTSALAREAYPETWKEEPQEVYGEKLPARLDVKGLTAPRLLVHVRPDVHRVMHLEFVEGHAPMGTKGMQVIPIKLLALETLERLPLGERTTSLYYQSWPLRGHVKGALKVWETMFLSWMPLDLFVGMDKAYGDREVTGNPFYTSLKPWNRKNSDMGDFAGFLKFYGWKL